MSDTTQQWEVTFTFIHCDAFSTVSVKAYDESHAVRLAESVVNKEFIPQLHHIQLIA